MKDKECKKSNIFTFGYGLCGGIVRAECNLAKGHKGKHQKIINKSSPEELQQVQYEWE